MKNFINQRFGKLLVIDRKRENNTTFYICICDCGNKTTTTHSNLVSGSCKSCGCLVQETRGKERLPIKDVVSRAVLWSYKRNAKLRNYEWNLDNNYFKDMIFNNCYYCGSPPSNNFRWKYKYEEVSFPVNGVDRIDNTIGYTKENCVTCCRTCNSAKGELSLTEFKEWVIKLFYQFPNR